MTNAGFTRLLRIRTDIHNEIVKRFVRCFAKAEGPPWPLGDRLPAKETSRCHATTAQLCRAWPLSRHNLSNLTRRPAKWTAPLLVVNDWQLQLALRIVHPSGYGAIMTAGQDPAGTDDTTARLDALEERFTLVESVLSEVLAKVTEAVEAAGIVKASPPPGKRKRHLTVVKGLLAGGLAGAAARKFLAGAVVTGTAAAAAAVVLLPSAGHVTPPRAYAAGPVPSPGLVRPALQPMVPVVRHHHAAPAVLGSGIATVPSSSGSPLISITPPSSSSPGSVKIRLPLHLKLPLKDPACIGLIILPPVCLSGL